MEPSVVTPQSAASDARHDTSGAHVAGSASDADKVININTDNARVEAEDHHLKRLLTDDYCYLCEAVLLFKSQRLSHYEGKKHAQKLKMYLQSKRDEKKTEDCAGPQRTMPTDKNSFCELCNMVFGSPVVAQSHYRGKVHCKNLRKRSLQTADTCSEVSAPPCSDGAQAPDTEPPSHPSASAEVDLKDPNKYCALCAACFNNPHMALQHYNGRKHLRMEARQEVLKELGDDGCQALMCHVCSVFFTSVEMFQAHMQGSKHQIREKKVLDLCRSQQRAYSSFADELDDYIQVQKARGLRPTTAPVPPPALQADKVGGLHMGLPPPDSHLGGSYLVNGVHPSYAAHRRRPRLGPAPTHVPLWPVNRKRQRNSSSSSSSSSWSTSSQSSSISSSTMTSDSDNSKHQRKTSRTTRRSRRARGVDSNESSSRKRRKREDHSEDRRRDGGLMESEERGRARKHTKNNGTSRRPEKNPSEEERPTEDCHQTAMMEERRPTDEGENRQNEDRPRCRREKKKTKQVVDRRTEEERLWDDSILGFRTL